MKAADRRQCVIRCGTGTSATAYNKVCHNRLWKAAQEMNRQRGTRNGSVVACRELFVICTYGNGNTGKASVGNRRVVVAGGEVWEPTTTDNVRQAEWSI